MRCHSWNDLSFQILYRIPPIGKPGPIRPDLPEQQGQFIVLIAEGQYDLRLPVRIQRDLPLRTPRLILKPCAEPSACRNKVRCDLSGILPAVFRTSLRGDAVRKLKRRQLALRRPRGKKGLFRSCGGRGDASPFRSPQCEHSPQSAKKNQQKNRQTEWKVLHFDVLHFSYLPKRS